MMKLLVTLNVVKLLLLCGNGFSWLPSINMTFTVLWTRVEKGLLILKTQFVSFDFLNNYVAINMKMNRSVSHHILTNT